MSSRATIAAAAAALLCALMPACGPTAPAPWNQESGYRWRELEVPRGEPGFTRMRGRTGIHFENAVSESLLVGNRVLGQGAGVSLGDVDGDGRVDVFLARTEGCSALYRNLGGWRFEDITQRGRGGRVRPPFHRHRARRHRRGSRPGSPAARYHGAERDLRQRRPRRLHGATRSRPRHDRPWRNHDHHGRRGRRRASRSVRRELQAVQRGRQHSAAAARLQPDGAAGRGRAATRSCPSIGTTTSSCCGPTWAVCE